MAMSISENVVPVGVDYQPWKVETYTVERIDKILDQIENVKRFLEKKRVIKSIEENNNFQKVKERVWELTTELNMLGVVITLPKIISLYKNAEN
jgi:hypothetical protein